MSSMVPYWAARSTGSPAAFQLLVERVEVHPDGLDLKLRVDGPQTLVADMRGRIAELRAA
jgi:hypothetical protein